MKRTSNITLQLLFQVFDSIVYKKQKVTIFELAPKVEIDSSFKCLSAHEMFGI